MKVHLGPYLNWWGPYQICDLLQKVGVSEDRCFELGKKLSETWVNDVCQWIYDKRNRTIKIRIDRYDSWSAHTTLSQITVPLLKQLKEHKHGAPFTDDEDAPAHLRSTFSKISKENDWDVDEFFFDRWDYILNEIIWAHEQMTDDDADAQFHVDGKYDIEGHKVHQARINNGFRLYGKYYQGLWD